SNPALASEEGFADIWAMYLNGDKLLVRKLGLEDAFADAARRLAFVPVKKRGVRKSLSDWFFKPGEVRTGSPRFAEITKHSKRWQATLTGPERRLVKRYTEEAYDTFNLHLARAGKHFDAESRLLERLLRRRPQKEPVYSWRIMNVRSPEAKQWLKQLDDAVANGGEIIHKPFASTSTKPGAYGSYEPTPGSILIEFKSKSGQYIRDISSYKTENEYLIAANTRFRVVGKERVKFKIQPRTSPTKIVTNWVYKLEEI
ncbi:hypothetical protein LCGC14_2833090, partial [marine sediment metagenome]